MIEELNKHQPQIIVNLIDSVHVLSVSLIRDIANGRIQATDEQARCIATALKDYIDND